MHLGQGREQRLEWSFLGHSVIQSLSKTGMKGSGEGRERESEGEKERTRGKERIREKERTRERERWGENERERYELGAVVAVMVVAARDCRQCRAVLVHTPPSTRLQRGTRGGRPSTKGKNPSHLEPA